MTNNSLPEGHYRIRKAGAKSDIANSISNGKKCHYVQIGLELFDFKSLEDARKFVEGKGLVADSMSLDFGANPSEPNGGDEAVANGGDDADVDGGDEAVADGGGDEVADGDDNSATA